MEHTLSKIYEKLKKSKNNKRIQQLAEKGKELENRSIEQAKLVKIQITHLQI